MKRILTWIARGGITAALVLLLVAFWPVSASAQSQHFDLSLAGSVPATITFQAPESVHRGAWASFSVSLDLSTPAALCEAVNPVMVYRLELEGAEIDPPGVYQIPLAGGMHQEAEWNVRLPDDGEYEGIWWVYVDHVASDGESVERQALFAKKFSIESPSILGLSSKWARWLGFAGILAGLMIEVLNIVCRVDRGR
ncbi:MAG: hypothetical protein K8R77_04545 [Anaerolineaceae bacterium]|nr:hypothetical protein [Anaerolineaceae bacterium]